MYYVARWYDPVLGRFAQADTIVPGAGNPMAWDRYAYTSNNPVNYTDPSGHCNMYMVENGECTADELTIPTTLTPTNTPTSTPTSTPTANTTSVAATANAASTQWAEDNFSGPNCTTPTPSPCLGPVCIPTSTPTPTAMVSFPLDEFSSNLGNGEPTFLNSAVLGLADAAYSSGNPYLVPLGNVGYGAVMAADAYNVGSAIADSTPPRTVSQTVSQILYSDVAFTLIIPILLVLFP